MFNNFRKKEFGIREEREASWSSELELLELSLGEKKISTVFWEEESSQRMKQGEWGLWMRCGSLLGMAVPAWSSWEGGLKPFPL